MHIDSGALDESLGRLRAGPRDGGLVRMLRQVLTAAGALFHHTGAGVMFIDDRDELRYVASTDLASAKFEEAQLLAGEGPCVDTFVKGAIVTSEDVHTDARWQRLSAYLNPEVRAVAGAPILLGRGPVGTLNVYYDHSIDWDDSDIAALAAYADLITELITASLDAHGKGELADQLQYALDYRVVIERAIGYIMAKADVDSVTAFTLLRKHARDRSRRVVDVAYELLDDPAGPPPPPPRSDAPGRTADSPADTSLIG